MVAFTFWFKVVYVYLHVQPFHRNAQLVQQALPCIRVLRVDPFYLLTFFYFICLTSMFNMFRILFDLYYIPIRFSLHIYHTSPHRFSNIKKK